MSEGPNLYTCANPLGQCFESLQGLFFQITNLHKAGPWFCSRVSVGSYEDGRGFLLLGLMAISAQLMGQSLVGTGSQPFAVAVNPATNKIYVVNNGPNTVTVIDGATNTTRDRDSGTHPGSDRSQSRHQ